uniref:Predicted protein n=1 Tax=Hordeum vulgare subsp. vulgare TaxID=112509 RepID=F2ECG5_HORVV|nr:predicted protein [Hordeum vulgare subsp. vulgare]
MGATGSTDAVLHNEARSQRLRRGRRLRRAAEGHTTGSRARGTSMGRDITAEAATVGEVARSRRRRQSFGSPFLEFCGLDALG